MANDQLDGDLHSVTDSEFFEALKQAKKIPVYDADGNEVDMYSDVVDARLPKAAIEAGGGTWKPEQFL